MISNPKINKYANILKKHSIHRPDSSPELVKSYYEIYYFIIGLTYDLGFDDGYRKAYAEETVKGVKKYDL